MIVWYKDNGEILQVIEVETPEALSMRVPEGVNILTGAVVNGPTEDHWVVNGGVVRKPDRPTWRHEFDYTKGEWFISLDALWSIIKAKRDALLKDTDWTWLRAAETGTQVPQEWLDYRQALRDITKQDPENIVWPVKPTS